MLIHIPKKNKNLQRWQTTTEHEQQHGLTDLQVFMLFCPPPLQTKIPCHQIDLDWPPPSNRTPHSDTNIWSTLLSVLTLGSVPADGPGDSHLSGMWAARSGGSLCTNCTHCFIFRCDLLWDACRNTAKGHVVNTWPAGLKLSRVTYCVS